MFETVPRSTQGIGKALARLQYIERAQAMAAAQRAVQSAEESKTHAGGESAAALRSGPKGTDHFEAQVKHVFAAFY